MTTLRSHPFACRWVGASLLIFCLCCLWAIATPSPSGPDEPAQLTKAAAVVRGNLTGAPDPGLSKGTVRVNVPATFASVRNHGSCDYTSPDIPTGCGPAVVGSSKLETISTYEGRYPPIYYAIVGIPSLFTSRPSVVYMMRALSSLIVAVLLGLAFAALVTWGRSRLVLAATAVTVSPTVLYLGAVVNPSAMEVAGGVALWATLSMLVFNEYEDPPMPLVVGAVIAAVALCASRPLSTFYFALIVASVVAFRPGRALTLLRSRRVQIGLAVSLLFALASGIFVLVAKSYEVEAFPIAKRSEVDYVLAVLGHTNRYLRQIVGAFGAPNFSVPVPVLMIWWIACAGFVVVGLVVASRHDAVRILVITALLGFVIPFVIIFSHIKTDGIIWQGRESLPLLVGLPLLGALTATERRPDPGNAVGARIGVVVLPVLVIGWIVSFYWCLRRYTVGLSFPHVNAFDHFAGSWAPVIPAIVICALFVAFILAWATWLLVYCLRDPGVPPPAPVDAGGSHWRSSSPEATAVPASP